MDDHALAVLLLTNHARTNSVVRVLKCEQIHTVIIATPIIAGAGLMGGSFSHTGVFSNLKGVILT